MKKIIIHHRSSHHSGYSGYGKLIDYLDDIEVVYGEKKILPDRLIQLIKNNANQNYGLYDSKSVHKNIELIGKLLFSNQKNDVLLHYLNGERDIRQATYYFNKKCQSIATFHKPPNLLHHTITNSKYLKKLDGGIAVGINQVDFLKNWLNTDNVEYIPHGVDTNFFKPNAEKKKENVILFVGQHLRDFEALNYAIPRLIEKTPSLKINVVLRKDFANLVNANGAITVYSGINDEQLRDLYQEATLLFLPLKNSTACNSILEAMACGLPIISTEVGGNDGYVKNGAGVLVPSNDYKALVDETMILLKNQEEQIEMTKISRETSLDYEWEKVAKKISSFYLKMKSIK